MNKLTLAGAAIGCAFLAISAVAADAGKTAIDAQATYKAAVAKAKSDHKNAVAECKKGPEDQRHACYKQARQAWVSARDAAAEAYTAATGKPEPSPGM
jgi:hypothetical protein